MVEKVWNEFGPIDVLINNAGETAAQQMSWRERRETPPGMRFLGLNALDTGSSRGFGRLIAIALAKEGANVVVHYNTNREGAEKTAEEIRALGRRAYIARADITKWSEVQEMVEKVWNEFGPIDVLINNAGETAAQQMSWREMRESRSSTP
jgi:3-oxoacyl-[acyl-carrier protein] reductase